MNRVVARTAGGFGLLLLAVYLVMFDGSGVKDQAPVGAADEPVSEPETPLARDELHRRSTEAGARHLDEPVLDDGAVQDESLVQAFRLSSLDFESSISAEQVLKKIANDRSAGENYKAELMQQQLDQFCDLLNMDGYSGVSDTDELTYGEKQLEEYCNGYFHSMENAGVVNDSLASARTAIEDRFIKKLDSALEPGKFDRALLESIVASSSHAEIDIIQAQIDAYRETGGAALVSLVGSDSLMLRDESVNWGDALVIYSCMKFGNCGRRSPRFIFHCFILQNDCERYSNVLDFVYDRLSPIDVQNVNFLLGEINKFGSSAEFVGEFP